MNKLIPHSSALMNRIEFIGNSLFIPFFLISVGMIVDVSVIMSTEKEVEFMEKDRDKVHKFIDAIRAINKTVKLNELYSTGMHKDTKGYDASEDKSLYQVDDDYYKRLVGEVVEEAELGQVGMF